MSVLKPFATTTSSSTLPSNNSATTTTSGKKPTSSRSYIESLLRHQVNFVNIATLLNLNLSILPFSSHFEQLYKFCSRFQLLTNLINNHAQLSQQQVRQELNTIIRLKMDQTPTFISVAELNDHLNQLSLSFMPILMQQLTQPKQNQFAQSICHSHTDSFELVMPVLEDLFSNSSTCVDSFVYLFHRLYRYVSRSVLRKKFLPILLQLINVVDLNETMGLDLTSDEKKMKFCRLFEFKFVNELKIIFGLEVFLVQICPFLIEAISGFKGKHFFNFLFKILKFQN